MTQTNLEIVGSTRFFSSLLGNGLFKLLPTNNYDEDDEHWEFLPGSIVRAREVRGVDGIYLLAMGLEA